MNVIIESMSFIAHNLPVQRVVLNCGRLADAFLHVSVQLFTDRSLADRAGQDHRLKAMTRLLLTICVCFGVLRSGLFLLFPTGNDDE